jgi:hypothetical protein
VGQISSPSFENGQFAVNVSHAFPCTLALVKINFQVGAHHKNHTKERMAALKIYLARSIMANGYERRDRCPIIYICMLAAAAGRNVGVTARPRRWR